MFKNKDIWKVSYPILLSLFAQNIIGVTDTAFLGRVSEVAIGASAMGGLFYICMYTIAFGFSTGSQIIIARRNGEGRHADVGPVMIQGLIFLLGLAFVVFGFTKLCGGSIISLLVKSDNVYNATVEFIDWRIYGVFFSFINVMFRAFYIGITRTKVMIVNAVVMALTNVVLDYILIFGKLGFPAMGIKGAAIASVLAEASSILFFVIYTYATVDFKKYGFVHLRHSFNSKLLKQILNISSFTMLQNFLSMGTWFVFFVAVERLGERDLAIANIVRSIYIMLLIPVQALATAANTLVSNSIGGGRIKEVPELVKRISLNSISVMGVILAFTALFPRTILSIYTNNEAIIETGVSSIYVVIIAMLVASVANVLFNAISGTGNTRSALALETIALIIYVVYVFIIGIILQLPVEICFTTEIVYYGLLLIVSYLYLKKGNWQNKKI